MCDEFRASYTNFCLEQKYYFWKKTSMTFEFALSTKGCNPLRNKTVVVTSLVLQTFSSNLSDIGKQFLKKTS